MPLDIAKLRGYLSCGTSLPWSTLDDSIVSLTESGAIKEAVAVSDSGSHYRAISNAILIVEAINALPQLLAIAEAACGVRDDYEDSELWTLPTSTRNLCAAVDAARKAGT